MKKIFLITISVLILFTLVACGDKKETAKPTETAAEEVEEVELVEEELDYTETDFWKAVFPEDWELSEEKNDVSDSYINQIYGIKKGDEFERKVQIYINEIKDPNNFRRQIFKKGIDLLEYSKQEVSDALTIDDIYFVQYKGTNLGSKSIEFLGRDEKSTSIIEISFAGEVIDPEIEKILETFILKAEDIGNVDPPYPWDGVRIELVGGEGNFGVYNISSKYLKFKEPYSTYETFEMFGVQSGEYLYILLNDNLKIYKLGDELELEKDIDLGGGFKAINIDKNGRVYISGFMNEVKIYEGLEEVMTLNIKDKVEINGTGDLLISYFLDPLKLSKNFVSPDGTFTTSEFQLVGPDGEKYQSALNKIFLLEDKIAAAGSKVETQKHSLVFYDLDGNYISELVVDDEFGMGSITGFIEGKNGYLASDGNMRKFYAWNKEGEYFGAIDDDKLLGTNYPWISSMTYGTDGSIYLTLSMTRDDKSSNEVIVYKIETDL